ncbi:MAG TPA: PD-(D/E)XK nuclease family protein [Streptosporangiaceae bacterium]|nr:PD-(D/E)XK nuclease family protein [Streptosporangiaceae bacterium]
MEQLGFEGMPRRLYSCTPTRLTTWLDCPRRYRMTYLDRPPPPKGPPWAHNSVGASVHNALAGWWRLPRAQRTVAAAGDLLDRGWLTDGFADDAQLAAQRRRWRPLVESYVARLDPDNEPLGVERTVATRTDLIAVSGRIDRLDDRLPVPAARIPPDDADRAAAGTGPDDADPGEDELDETDGGGEPGGLVVVDYKTGRHLLTVDDARSSLPLALYALAAARVMRRPCLRVELHHLPTGRVLAWEHTPQSLARQLHRAEDIAEECARADDRYRDPAGDRGDATFPPQPGPRCGWCDYRSHCPEGSAAATGRRPWDGLDLEVAPVLDPD